MLLLITLIVNHLAMTRSVGGNTIRFLVSGF